MGGSSGCAISCSLFSNVTLKKLIRTLFSVGFCDSSICTFLRMGFNYSKPKEPLKGDILLFTTKSPWVPSTHFINLEKMKGWVNLGATQWFWTQDWRSSILTTKPMPHVFCYVFSLSCNCLLSNTAEYSNYKKTLLLPFFLIAYILLWLPKQSLTPSPYLKGRWKFLKMTL